MAQKIIGREREQKILRECVDSGRPEFVAVYGRRRIGKTYLVRNFFKGKFDFYMTGSFNATIKEQLGDFHHQLEEYSGRKWPVATSWREAFRQLQEYLSGIRSRKIIVFIDELPWLDTPRSRFISALEMFWNGWADWNDRMKLIVCGSATTWMTHKLIGNKGGLHNRVTRQLYLAPFNLHDTELLLRSVGVEWNRHQIVEAYMAVGGVPFYLSKMDRSQSVSQNIDRLFFHDKAELKTEYNVLFRSLFKDSAIYREVVDLMAGKAEGMTREELLHGLSMDGGGKLSEVLENLVTCDFIREYQGFGKKVRGRLYQLTDLFTLFYLKQVRPNPGAPEDYWSVRIDSPSHRAWAGYAFEQVCLNHVSQIKRALGISGIQSTVSAWRGVEDRKPVAQIDLVIDRRDDVVNLCEMKYSLHPYDITPSYLEKLVERREIFRRLTGTRKALHLTMVTLYGLQHNAQWGMIQNEVDADQLFAE